MLIKQGYITGNLDELNAYDLECTIEDLDHSLFLDNGVRNELMEEYIQERWFKRQEMFQYTPENIKKLDEANELLKRSTEKISRRAWKIFQMERESMRRNPVKTFNQIEVEPHLMVPHAYEFYPKSVFDGKIDVGLWDSLADYYHLERVGGILMGSSLSTMFDNDMSEDDYVSNSLWGVGIDETEKITSWGHGCMMDEDATKDICFVWPFHQLVSHENMTLSDLIKIKEYKELINVEYWRNDDD
jgi:hypothetical protein